MESLPVAPPDVLAGLLRADRGTAAVLAVQPGAPAGTAPPARFAALLALLSAPPASGEALPVGGKALPPVADLQTLVADAAQEPLALPFIASAGAKPADTVRAPVAPPAPNGARLEGNLALPLTLAPDRLAVFGGTTGPDAAPLAAGLSDELQRAVAAPATVELRAADLRPDLPQRSVSDVLATPDGGAAAAPQPARPAVASAELHRFAAWLEKNGPDATPHAPLRPASLRSVEPLERLGAERILHDRANPEAALRAPAAADAASLLERAQRAPIAKSIHSVGTAAAAEVQIAAQRAVPDVGAPALPAAPSAATPLGRPELALPTPGGSVDLGAPRWQEALVGRINVLIDHGGGEARIKLNPPELGMVDVKIAVQDDKTYVQLAAASAAARDELTQSLPRLRELLSFGGLSLGGASVSDGSGGRQSAPAGAPATGSFAAAVDRGAASAAPLRAAARTSAIDVYA